MKQHFLKISILTAITCQLLSCDTVKRVGENEHLLTSNTVIVNDKNNKTETISNLLYQKPNSKIPILGTPLRLQIYNLARPNIDSILDEKIYNNPKKLKRKTALLSRKQLDKYVDNRISFNNWLKTTGEAPVIVNVDKTEKSVKRIKDYHINNGWFDVEANYSINKKNNKRADVEYTVNTGPAFILDTITTKIKSPVVDSIYHKTVLRNSLIKPNEQYRTSSFEQERERISNELRNSGLFHFNQDYIAFEIDTIGTNKKVNVDIQIQDRAIRTQNDSLKRVPFNIYKVKDVSIFTDYTFDKRNQHPQDSVKYNGYTLYSYGKMRYRPKAITDAIFITPGNIFKDNDRTLTYRHINGLRTFKYPNIEQVEKNNHTLSDTIRLTPLKKFNLGFSADVSQSNIQTIGLSLNPSLLIRNIFRGAETLEISAIGSIGSSKDKNNINDPFFDINEIGADLKLTIPRFFFPFNTNRIIAKDMSPSTRISLSTTSQTNIGLDKQTVSGAFNYNWSPSRNVTNQLDVFNMQYVRNLNVNNYFNVYTSSFDNLENIALSSYNTPVEFINVDDNGNESLIIGKSDEFINLVLTDNTYQNSNPEQYKTVNNISERKNRLTENNLILASNFSLTNDERTNLFDEDFSIFRFKIEAAGNLISGLSDILGLKKNTNNRYELFNVAYSQYIKTELDYVKHWDLGKKNIIAMRSFLGIAIPLGNSTNIPFSKSFFAGGANDNRAWTAYSLGPGSSRSSNDFNEANLKITLGLEQRFNIFENLNGAFFVDAGNIWNVLDDVEDENAVFSDFNSLKDIAVGSGFGLRYDFSFFVFRFDVGFKTYDPSYQDQNRWFKDYNFSNAVYNIGINYPF